MQKVTTRLFSRLYTKFGLEPQAPQGSTFLYRGIVPVTDVASVLDFGQVVSNTLSQSGIGTQILAQVPAGRRWHVSAIWVNRTTGSRDLNDVWIADVGQVNKVLLVSGVGTTKWISGVFSPIIMEEGWTILGAFDTAGGADGDWATTALARVDFQQAFGPPN